MSMSIVSRARLTIARRPWIYWGAVALLVVAAVLSALGRLHSVDVARSQWGTRVPALVARRDHRPGDELDAEWRDVPVAVLPPSALGDEPSPATVRQRIAEGEVIVELDVVDERGPAGHTSDGRVVVPIDDPLFNIVEIGSAVAVYAEGVVIADDAVVVDDEEDVVYVAVDADDAPIVAAAARGRTASIVYIDL